MLHFRTRSDYESALMWGAYAIGLLSSLFCYLYLRSEGYACRFFRDLLLFLVTAPSYNVDGSYTAPLLLFSFFIGMVCCALLSHRFTPHFSKSLSIHVVFCNRSRSVYHVSRLTVQPRRTTDRTLVLSAWLRTPKFLPFAPPNCLE